MPISDHTHPKITEVPSYFPDFVSACKKQFIPLIPS